MACCIRCLSSEGKFCLPLTSQHKALLTALMQSLAGPVPQGQDETGISVQQSNCEQAFQKAFFTLASGCLDQSTGSRFDSVLYCFLAVSSVDKEGKFLEPKQITSPLAAWKFLLRCTIMRYAHDNPNQEKGIIG